MKNILLVLTIMVITVELRIVNKNERHNKNGRHNKSRRLNKIRRHNKK